MLKKKDENLKKIKCREECSENLLKGAESLNQIEAFLNKEKDTIKPSNSRCFDDVFDTVSDVSSEDSDIQIVHVSDGSASTDASLKVKKSKYNNSSLDYLNKSAICVIKSSKNYHNFEDLLNEGNNLAVLSSENSEDNSDSFVKNNSTQAMQLENENARNIQQSSIQNVKPQRKRKSQKRFPDNPELKKEPRMFKYWSQRYDLFERFDMGIKLDKESWFSVTPEAIAKEHSELCEESDTVLDGFCGAGGNTIQFACRCKKVYAVDIDQVKVNLTKNNCQVYGIPNEKVTVLQDDFHSFCSLYNEKYNKIKDIVSIPAIQVVYLSPPWGGQDYLSDNSTAVFDLSSISFDKILNSSRIIRPRMIIVYLPRNTDEEQLKSYISNNETLTIMKHTSHYKNNTGSNKIKAITAVFKSSL